MVDINASNTWNLGCTVGPAVQVGAGKQNISALDTAQVWIDTCTATLGSNPRWAAEGSAVLRHYNSGPVVNDTGPTGTVSAYAG